MKNNLFNQRQICKRVALVLLALLAAVSLLPPAGAQSTESVGDSRPATDTPVATTAKLAVSLQVSPKPLTYGRVADAVVTVNNDSSVERQIVIKALLGEVAHFVSSDSGARFDTTEAQQERTLVWPSLTLSSGATGQVEFSFLVSWDVSGDVYLQVDAIDAAGDLTPAVASLREPPRYPDGGGGLLASYGYLLATLSVFGLLVFGVRRASQRMKQGHGIASGLSGIALGSGVVMVLLSASLLWSEIEPWLGWKQTLCRVLDVRYSVDTTTSSTSTGSSRQRSTHYFYSGSLALEFQGPDGPIISTGYRKQSSVSDPQTLNQYQAGTDIACYYDPADPGWVVVERDLTFSNLVWVTVLTALGLLLIWFGWRSRRKAPE